VEAGKKAAAAILDLQRQVIQVLHQETTPISLFTLAEKINAPDQIETIYWILRHLNANQRVTLQGSPGQPTSLIVQAK
jgi:glucose-6-phosphate isomerase